MDDLGVNIKGDSLKGKKILLGITGGIAATQSIKLLRELRRYQAEITVIMTDAAQKVIFANVFLVVGAISIAS